MGEKMPNSEYITKPSPHRKTNTIKQRDTLKNNT